MYKVIILKRNNSTPLKVRNEFKCGHSTIIDCIRKMVMKYRINKKLQIKRTKNINKSL